MNCVAPEKLFQSLAGVPVVMVAKTLNVALQLGIGIIISRQIGSEGKGIVSLALGLGFTACMLCSLGMDLWQSYLVSRDRQFISSAKGNSLFFGIIVGTVGAVIGYYGFGLPNYLDSLGATVLWVAFARIPLCLTYRFLKAVLVGADKSEFLSAIEVIESLTTVALLTLLFPSGFIQPSAVIVCFCISMFLVSVAIWIALHRLDAKLRISMKSLWRGRGFCLRSYVSDLASVHISQVDLLLLGLVLGIGDVGVYSIALSVFGGCGIVAGGLSQWLFPKMVAKSQNEVWRMLHGALLGCLLVMATLLLAESMYLGPALLWIYGPQFVAASGPIMVLTAAAIFAGFSSILVSYAATVLYPGVVVWIWVTGFLLKLVMGYLSLRLGGGTLGLAWATLAVYMFIFATIYLALRKRKTRHAPSPAVLIGI